MRRYTVTSQTKIEWKRTGGWVTGSRTAINIWSKLVWYGEGVQECAGGNGCKCISS